MPVTAASDADNASEPFSTAYEFAKSIDASDHTFVLGPVLVPEMEDRQGDIADAAEIEKAAHEFLAESRRPGLMHSRMLASHETQVVESYLLRQPMEVGGTTLPVGTWMIGMKVYSPRIRKAILGGELRGFSIGGRAHRIQMEDRT